MWSNKVLTICIIIVCMLLGAFLGYVTYQKESKEAQDIKDQINSESVEGEDEYITQLRNYEESMKACEEAYALAVEQRDTLKAYADNSIIMKIDPTDVKVAYCAYVISDTNNTANILSALHAYIYDGGLKEDAANNGGEDLEIEGWKDVVSAGTAGNNLFIAVNHYDADKAKEIMDVIQKCVEEETSVLAKTQGDYSITLTSESYYSKEDLNVVNTQNNINNTLKTYENAISDQLNKINNLKTTIETYKEKNEITEGGSVHRGLTKTLLLYVILGLIGGVVLAFITNLIRSSVSNVIQCTDHLRYSGVTILNTYFQKKKEFDKSIEDTVLEIERIATANNSNRVCFYTLGDSKNAEETINQFKDKMTVDVVDKTGLYDCKHAIIIVMCGKDMYLSMEETLSMFDRLGINLLGVITFE